MVDPEDLEAEVWTLLDEIVNLPAEGMYFGKLAINRAVENSGLRAALHYSYALNVMSNHSEGAAKNWAAIRAEKGLDEALRWRDSNT